MSYPEERNDRFYIGDLLSLNDREELIAEAHKYAQIMKTKEQKKARRKLRHELMAGAWKHAAKRTGMFATNGQLTRDARILTDRLLSAMAHTPTAVKSL